jgi:hypothetical protein
LRPGASSETDDAGHTVADALCPVSLTVTVLADRSPADPAENAGYFFVLLRDPPVLELLVRVDFARVVFARPVVAPAEAPEADLPREVPLRAVCSAPILFTAALPADFAALPAARTAVSASFSILPAAFLAWLADCSAFLACRVAAAFFAEADL